MQQEKTILNIVNIRALAAVLVSVAVIAAISMAFFAPALSGNVLAQSDVQQGIANSHEASLFKATTGEPTRWTNSLFSGMPTFQIQPSYSSARLMNWINDVYGLFLPSPCNLLFMMMIGFFILLIALRLRWYLALIGAIAWGFSTYFIIIIGAGHIWKFATLAYVPPTIAGIILAYRGKYLAGSAMAALFAMMQISRNHVQMSYYFALLIVCIVVAYLVSAIRGKRLAQWGKATAALAAAAVLAVAANVPNLYNTYKYSKETIRGGHSELATDKQSSGEGLDKDYITAWSYGKAESWTLLVPNANGGATIKPEKGQNNLVSLADTDEAQSMYNSGEISPEAYQYLSQFPQYFGSQPMTNGPVYVGAIIFALFLLGCVVVKGPLKWALMVGTVISLFLSWGHNMMWLTDLMIDYFPLYNKFRTVSSILVVAEFTIPLLAVLALNEMLTDKDFMRKHIWAFAGAFGFCILSCLVMWIMPAIFSLYSETELEQYIQSGVQLQFPELFAAVERIRASLISGDAIRSLIILILGGKALFLGMRGTVKMPIAVAFVGVLTLLELYAVNKRYISADSFMPASAATTNFEKRPVDEMILQDTAQNYRVIDFQHFSEAKPSYYHKHVGGYHAAKLTRYQDLIEHQIAKNNMQVLNMLNTKYFIVNDTECQKNATALGNAWFVQKINYVQSANEEMQALNTLHTDSAAVADASFKAVLGEATPTAPGDTIYETSYAPNRLTYHANTQNGALAVFSEIYFPWGWEAEIDGEPAQIGRVNYVLRAMQIPAGKHSIVMTFNPKEVETSDNVATAAILLIYVLVFAAFNLGIYRKLRQGDEDNE